MDRVFNSHTGERDAQLLREAQRDVGLTALLARAEGGNGMSKAPISEEKFVENV
jgi:hypothetical protein